MIRHKFGLVVGLPMMAFTASLFFSGGDLQAGLRLDPCQGPPDAIHYVLAGDVSPGGAMVFDSGGADYGYRSCPYYTVDVKVGSYSPTLQAFDPASYDAAHPLRSYDSSDLPGSAAWGLTLPITNVDCQQYSVGMKAYTKPATDNFFTFHGEVQMQGVWTVDPSTWQGTCALAEVANSRKGSLFVETQSTGAGWDTYRFLVSVVERGSFQQAQVTLLNPLPPPR